MEPGVMRVEMGAMGEMRVMIRFLVKFVACI